MHRNQRLKKEIITASIANTIAIMESLLCFLKDGSSIIFNNFCKPERNYENQKLFLQRVYGTKLPPCAYFFLTSINNVSEFNPVKIP